MPPASAHLARRMWDAAPAEVASQILYQTASMVVAQPVYKIMQAREIFACALTAAISVQLDVIKQAPRRPVRFGLVKHSGEAKCNLEKGPAIHPLKIHRWRLDSVINFQSKMFVPRSNKCLPNCSGSFPNRQTFPIASFSCCNQTLELLLPLKNRVKCHAQ